ADVVLFTSSNQVTNVMQVAEDDGASVDFTRGLAAAVIASVGPVCSEELRRRGIGVDIEPDHPKLGHLVKAAAMRGRAILSRKRAAPGNRAAHDGARVSDRSADEKVGSAPHGASTLH